MTDRQTLTLRLEALRGKYTREMRGRLAPTHRAQALRCRIVQIQEDIARLDREASEMLALSKAPTDEVLEVIAVPLLADVLTEIVAGVDAMLRRNGVQETVFGMYTAQIRKAALAIVDTLEAADKPLPRLQDEDDTLVDAIRKKLMSFIRQRLNIAKQ